MQPSRQHPILAYIWFIVSLIIFGGLAIIGFIIFSWLLIIAAVIGLVLFVVAYIKIRFFSPKKPKPPTPTQGNIYDHDPKE